jgi:dipeptidyl aminopeptidase/acylaminoacyl peptidase
MLRSRLRQLFCISLLLWTCQAEAQAKAQLQTAPKLLEQTSCFGAFKSYDQWMDFLRKKNSTFAYLAIRWKFPRAEYERYQRELDCRAISYQSDQHVVHGWLVQPKNRQQGRKVPIIIYNRGGNRSFGAVTFAHLFTHILPMAEQGYVVAASQYRGAIPVEGEKTSPDQFGGDDVRDVTNLMRLVIKLPQADPNNLFMIGQSRGAIMTFRALLDTPVPVRAVAIYSGVYDLRDMMRFRPGFDELYKELIPDYAKRGPAELDRRSVTRWPARLPAQTGLLLIHGDDDERAPISSAKKFAGQLTTLGRPHKAIFYPGESHFLDGHRSEVQQETLKWFRKFQKRTPPSAPALSS